MKWLKILVTLKMNQLTLCIVINTVHESRQKDKGHHKEGVEAPLSHHLMDDELQNSY